jgi:hypothetical protein
MKGKAKIKSTAPEEINFSDARKKANGKLIIWSTKNRRRLFKNLMTLLPKVLIRR